MTILIIWLVILGLCLGSFINAAVWRIHEQASEREKSKPRKIYLKKLSITRGRSMCSHCHHVLSAKDLIPVISWLNLRGKCRYCGKPIPDTPFSEIITPILFVLSYIFWPFSVAGSEVVVFILWLILLVGLMILLIYDLRWLLLPDRVVFPLFAVALVQAVFIILRNNESIVHSLLSDGLAILIGGGLFYILFQVSQGRWIGGGDVKLGWLLGLMVGTPAKSLLLIFIAAVGGSLVSLPLLLMGRLKRTSIVPFGPFLIVAAIIVQLFGTALLSWYERILLT